eukprot:4696228-Alexandrium_andersonii.AAC.1
MRRLAEQPCGRVRYSKKTLPVHQCERCGGRFNRSSDLYITACAADPLLETQPLPPFSERQA